MHAALRLVVIGAVAGCLLPGCGSSRAGRPPLASYQDMRTLARAFEGREFLALHTSSAEGGPFEAYPAKVTCKKTGPYNANCVLTFWPIRYNSSGIEYRYTKQGPASFKVTVIIGPNGRTIQPSVPQREGLAQ